MAEQAQLAFWQSNPRSQHRRAHAPDFTASPGGGNELLTGRDASFDAAVAIAVTLSSL